MGIVFPGEAVARRWDGALQARLRRAPLEAFLKTQSVVLAPAGVAQDTDNLARATVLIVEAGLKLHFGDRTERFVFHQRAVVAQIACLISRALSDLISQPETWRIVALISTARVLSPWIGLNAAAIASASAARRFQKELTTATSALERRIGESAATAVNRNDAEAIAEAAAGIAARLRTPQLEFNAANSG